MTISEIIAQVKQHGFQDQTDKTVFSWINEAYHQVNGFSPDWGWSKNQPYTLAIPANSSQVQMNFANEVIEIREVFRSDWPKLEVSFVEPEDLFRMQHMGSQITSDQPLYYSVWDQYDSPTYQGTFRVYPKSVVGYNLDLLCRMEPYQLAVAFDGSGNLTTDDSPPWPLHHHPILIQGALIRAYQRFDDLENLRDVESRFMAALGAMEKDLNQKTQKRIVQTYDDTDAEYNWNS